MIERIKKAWAILLYGDGLERRALSFALAALEHLERDEWNNKLVRVIAHEAVLRGLATAHEAGVFQRSTKTLLLHAITKPVTQQELQNL